MRKIYFQQGITGYGARFYVAEKDISDHPDSRYDTPLQSFMKVLCAWGNIDKTSREEKWVSYEMPPVKDSEIFVTVLEARFSVNVEVLHDSISSWEQFLAYCKEV